MSDLKIHEFRERAERGLDLPDFAEIERHGRALRRRRVAAVVGGLALVLVAGGGVATLATERTDDTLPATPVPSTTAYDDGVETRYDDAGEELLLPGEVQRTYDKMTVRFDVVADDWEWWDVGFGVRSTGEIHEYTAAVFFMPAASARLEPCTAARAQRLGTDPDELIGNVAPLLGLVDSTVLQRPRVVSAFGRTAVHLRLETTGSGCQVYGEAPPQLRGVADAANFDPGWGGRRDLDLWHVVAPAGEERAGILVAVWDLDRTAGHTAEVRAMLDSLRIEAD